MQLTKQQVMEKWAPVLDSTKASPIKDAHRRWTTAVLLENSARELSIPQAAAMNSGLLTEAAPTNATGSSVDNYDPILISLVRRAAPNLIAYDVVGVQPMTGPSGLIFAMRSRYANQEGTEAFYNEANTAYATVVSGANTLGQKHVGTVPGNTTVTSNLASTGFYNFGSAMSTAQAEALGSSGNVAIPEMALSIEKITATAGSRALKAEYSIELAQDLKAIHGLDADSELANILQTEILTEINRETIRTIYVTAKQGAADATTAGVIDLDVDANGRWMVEKFKGLMFQLEREANAIAKDTRRGKGNILICSSDVASALQMAGVLDFAPALNSNNLQVDDTGVTFAGVLNGRMRVYIDPYAGGNFAVVGYKGANPWDSGLFYCPYVPLQMLRATDPNTFAPKIGFKTRYAMVANPFAEGATAGNGALTKDSNVYYRRLIIANLM